jgi:hypothetical protein
VLESKQTLKCIHELKPTPPHVLDPLAPKPMGAPDGEMDHGGISLDGGCQLNVSQPISGS